MQRSSTVPTITTFPSHDERFRAAVAKACERSTLASPAGLAELLRPSYPAVEARERQPLARVDNELTEVWYVFRDGQLVRGEE